jgi:NADPH:quinone reductase-like Zn-dependent oxidoreductase
MKAIVYTKYGTPEVLHVEEVEKPAPSSDEILIRVHAAEATKSDCELRRSSFAVQWFWLPLRIAMGILKPRNQILGGYFSGVVESVGDGVTKFRKGEKVFGSAGMRMGAYGEYLSLPASSTIVQQPSNLSFEEAAAVPLGGLNALHYMRLANIQSGERVLINGAGASIGCFAVRIAKSMGAVVTAVDSSIKEEMLRSIGADHFVDYAKEDFTTAGQNYDVIFDIVAGSSYTRCVGALNPNGRYLMANPRLSDMLRSVVSTWCTNKTVLFAFAGETEEELLALKKMIEDGEIAPTVDQVFSPEQASEAHRRVEAELRLGSVVISL